MGSTVWVSQGAERLDLHGLIIVDFTPRKGYQRPTLQLYWKNGETRSFYGSEALSLARTINILYPHLKVA